MQLGITMAVKGVGMQTERRQGSMQQIGEAAGPFRRVPRKLAQEQQVLLRVLTSDVLLQGFGHTPREISVLLW